MLNFYLLLNCPIWPIRLRMFVIGQAKSEKKYQSARNLLTINFIGRCGWLPFPRSNNRELTQQDDWNTQDGKMTKKCRVRLGMHSVALYFFVILPFWVFQPSFCVSSLLIRNSPGITASVKTLWNSMAVVNEYQCTFLKGVQLIDFVNDRMPPASMGKGKVTKGR